MGRLVSADRIKHDFEREAPLFRIQEKGLFGGYALFARSFRCAHIYIHSEIAHVGKGHHGERVLFFSTSS